MYNKLQINAQQLEFARNEQLKKFRSNYKITWGDE